MKLTDADIRDGLKIAHRQWVRHFQSKGNSERKAHELATKMMATTSGARVRAGHRHDEVRQKASDKWVANLNEQIEADEKAKDDAEIEAARKRGRIILGGSV